MMTLMARLCALCAVCALMQMTMGAKYSEGLRMIGGLLMLHLVISGAQALLSEMMAADSLTDIYAVLIG